MTLLASLRRRGRLLPPVLAASVLSVLPFVAHAQVAGAQVPPNAPACRYGDGWECDPGQREAEGGCVAVVVPQSASGDRPHILSGL